MNVHKDCFSKIYIFSPTVHSDPAWAPVIWHMRDDLRRDNKKDKCLFEDYACSRTTTPWR